MPRVLTAVEWGQPALSLLRHTQSLNSLKPAVLHIRHTARTQATKGTDGRTLVSTPMGRQAAVEFGESLPKNRRYKLYHTYMDRARETAEEIHRGITESGGVSEIAGRIEFMIILDRRADMEWTQSQRYFPEDGAYHKTCQWLAGLIPEENLKPSMELAHEISKITTANLVGAPSDAFHIYISHDIWILALMFHWFGVPPHPGGLRFLDGFLMQLDENQMNVWFRDVSESHEYPHWWPKQTQTD